MDVLRVDKQARMAEMSFQGGCPVCGGNLVVRTTPHGAWSHCGGCRRIARSKVALTPVDVQLLHPVVARA